MTTTELTPEELARSHEELVKAREAAGGKRAKRGVETAIFDQTLVPKGIAGKLVKILEAAGTVKKNGHNKAQNYWFVRETDLVDMIRPIMAAEKLFLNLDVIAHELVELGKTASNNTMRLTILTVQGTWVDAETGDVWPLPSTFVGYGADTGDKGVYKAMTGAEKYFLFKAFLVGTGDDPEADEKTDRNAGGGPTRVRRSTPSNDTARGGRARTATGPQLTAVTRLVRQIGLTPEAFRQLIAKETGEQVPEDAKISDWLRTQPGGLVGKLIASLTTLAEEGSPSAVDPSHSLDEERGGDTGGNDSGGGAGNGDDDLPL